MSSPKSDGYRVALNREVEERARLRAVDEAGHLELRLTKLCERVKKFQREVGREAQEIHLPGTTERRPTTLSTRAAAEAYLTRLGQELSTLESSFQRVESRIGAQKLFAQIVRDSPVKVTKASDAFVPKEPRPLSRAPTETAEEQRRQREAQVRQALSLLHAGTSEEQIARLKGFAERVICAPSQQRAQMMIDELRGQVRTLNEEHAASQIEAAEARGLRLQLNGLSGATVDRVALQLQVVERGELRLSPALRTQAKSAFVDAKSRADAAYAYQVVRQGLADLGYEVVEQDFSTVFVEGGMAHFQQPDWGDYFMRMRVNPEEGFLNFNMVRAQENGSHQTRDQRVRDVEMEREWCPDHDRLLAGLQARGLGTTSVRRLPPGAVPIQVVPVESIPGRKAQAGQRRAGPSARSVKPRT